MEKLAYYDQTGKPWLEEENQQLTEEYNDAKLDIIQIGYNHKRTPGSIAYRLKTLNLITIHLDARGYQDYHGSDLYREIVNTANEKKVKKQEEKEPTTPVQLADYVNDTKRWSASESETLIKEYSDQLGLLELCKLHKRLPATIISRLKKHNLIKNTTDCNGLAEYKKSDLCKQVLAAKKQKEENVIVNPQNNLELEVAELREELNSVKATLQQILNRLANRIE